MSDIHGMYSELASLLRLVNYDPDVDTLTVLGDYIDRGLHSKEVIEFFMDLKARHASRVTLLKGNHEDLCLKAHYSKGIARVRALVEWTSNGGDTTLRSFDNKIPVEVIAFMEEMPLYAETLQYIFVHAGVPPSQPLPEVDPMALLWSRASSLPHYSGKMVIAGHSIRDEVTYNAKANTLYIDTGACKAELGFGNLSLVDLTNRKIHWVTTGGLKPSKYEEKELIIESS